MLVPVDVETLRRPLRIARLVRRASRAYGASWWAVWRRALLLYRGYGFKMEDAAPLGLLDPAFPESRFGEFVPLRKLNPLQRRLSPPALTAAIDDKVLFAVVCRAARLPTPRLRAIVRRGRSGWTEVGATPGDREEWAAALASLSDGEVIAKPARGDQGSAVRAFELRGGRVFENDRELGDGGALFDSLTSSSLYDEFALQERLRNHEQLTELSGSKTLQTLRIWTLLETPEVAGPEEVTVLGGKLKFAITDTAADNPLASKGNGFSLVDLETGTLGPLVRERSDGMGQEVLERHPRSGAVYEGVRLLMWHDAVELTRRAAAAFPLLRTLGWDIALTPDGPVVIEANAGWGASNEVGVAPKLLARLEAALRSDGQAREPTAAGT
jgi:hypothetical protein